MAAINKINHTAIKIGTLWSTKPVPTGTTWFGTMRVTVVEKLWLQKHQRVKCDGQTERLMDGPTERPTYLPMDGPTNLSVGLRSMQLKIRCGEKYLSSHWWKRSHSKGRPINIDCQYTEIDLDLGRSCISPPIFGVKLNCRKMVKIAKNHYFHYISQKIDKHLYIG